MNAVAAIKQRDFGASGAHWFNLIAKESFHQQGSLVLVILLPSTSGGEWLSGSASKGNVSSQIGINSVDTHVVAKSRGVSRGQTGTNTVSASFV